MFKRGKKFTLIELIVVIAVLGILAAIVIPNISNFQNKARDTQLTADTRNVQTALDMYRLEQPDGAEPILVDGSENKVTLTATHEFDKDGNLQEISVKVGEDEDDKPIYAKEKHYRVLDLNELYPNYLRQIPKYAVVDPAVINAKDASQIAFEDGGKVVFATLLEYELDENGKVVFNEDGMAIASNKSTAIVNALSYVKDADGNPQLTVVR